MVTAAAKELYPQLLLQLHQLPGKSGLGQMEQSGGLGDVFLPGYCQKISQNTKFHEIPPGLILPFTLCSCNVKMPK